MRQNCETLNNILLAEFDYFSNHLVEDFQAMMQRFLLRQVDFHKQVYIHVPLSLCIGTVCVCVCARMCMHALGSRLSLKINVVCAIAVGQ